MGKTFRDRPANERQIVVKKHEKGKHRKMDPYNRKQARRSDWKNQ